MNSAVVFTKRDQTGHQVEIIMKYQTFICHFAATNNLKLIFCLVVFKISV